MNRVFRSLHALGVMAVLALCLSAAQESVAYYGSEPFAFTYSRSLPALLCGMFAASHLYLAVSGRLTLRAALTFYPLCLGLGLFAELIARGSAKSWAPAPPAWAIGESIVGYILLAALAVICATSCYRSFLHGSRAKS